jgi:rfaE bifunctional protein kinase chain/domain
MNQHFIQAIHQFKSKNIAVIGDVMIDYYINGKVDRISPEAPVPIVHVANFENRIGGAANVALNITSLQAKCTLFSVIGNDVNGKNLISICKKNKINHQGLISSKSRRTTIKTRVIGNQHQLVRFDIEDTFDINSADENELVKRFIEASKKQKFDAVILEDYNKGVLTKNLISKIIDYCNQQQIPTLVDPKKNNFLAYKNCTLFKPNLKEIKESLGQDIIPEKSSLIKASTQLSTKLKHQITIITLAEKGIFYKQKNEINILPAHVRNIADVSGAGDTVISVLALGLATKLSLPNMVELSNLAGGLVCEMPGVVPISTKILLHELSK